MSIKTEQIITGRFIYQDDFDRIDVASLMKNYREFSTKMELLGLIVLSCINLTDTHITWKIKFPNTDNDMLFTLGNLSDGKNILLLFKLETLENELTEQQAKWLMNYLMEIIIYENKPQKEGFWQRMLENELCQDDLVWNEY